MKIKCNVVKDLLPLYYDNVCSEESTELIEQHLSECNSCSEYYKTISEADKIAVPAFDESAEFEKANSFRQIKKKIWKKQFIVSAFCILALLIIVFVTTVVLKNMTDIVPYENNNISVNMIDNSLVARLKGSVWEHCTIKRVETENEVYMFFYLTQSKWDDLISNSDSFTEVTVTPADKEADSVDKVYYYTGDYTGLEEMSTDELEFITGNSILLWDK